jgi:hypothetical protein
MFRQSGYQVRQSRPDAAGLNVNGVMKLQQMKMSLVTPSDRKIVLICRCAPR